MVTHRLRALLLLASSTAACTGADGMNGANGSDGMDGSIVQTGVEPAGANCENGGTKLEIGHDADDNGTLSGAEIEQTVYICDGDDGTPGTAGLKSLISVTAEPAGANCAAGGQKVEYGVDDDNDGTLEAGEVDGAVYVCDGADGLESLITTGEEPPGENCMLGGTKITSGIDDNGNNTLDTSEVDATEYVCNLYPPGTLYLSQDSNASGLYRLDAATGQSTLIGTSGTIGSTVGLTYDPSEGVLLGSKWMTLLAIATDGSGVVDRGGTASEALAYDWVSGVLYATINGQFFTMDKTNGAHVTTLAAPGFDAEGLAFRPDTRTIYAVGRSDGNLHAYDIATNTWSVVGPHGLNSSGAGLAYDPWRNVLYATGGSDGNLYRISPISAQSTLIGATGLTTANGGLEYVPAVYP